MPGAEVVKGCGAMDNDGIGKVGGSMTNIDNARATVEESSIKEGKATVKTEDNRAQVGNCKANVWVRKDERAMAKTDVSGAMGHGQQGWQGRGWG